MEISGLADAREEEKVKFSESQPRVAQDGREKRRSRGDGCKFRRRLSSFFL